MPEPRVLIAAPTSARHAYVIDEWLKSVNEWDYPVERMEVMLVENTPLSDDPHGEFYTHLKNLVGKSAVAVTVARLPWDRRYEVVDMLAACRELYRQVAYYKKFDYLFHLDTDTILPRDALKKLISRDKDQIGPVVKVFPKGTKKNGKFYNPPCVFKQTGFSKDGLFYYSEKELKDIEAGLVKNHKPRIAKVAAAALGCLLVKRKVFKAVSFQNHDVLPMGEDIWYDLEAERLGFESWVDFTVKAEHKNTDWEFSQTKEKLVKKIWFGYGNEDAEEAIIMDHVTGVKSVVKRRRA